MARIVGVDIPRNKKVPYSLCYIHGIGLTTARMLCQKAKIDENSRVQLSVSNLTDERSEAFRFSAESPSYRARNYLQWIPPRTIALSYSRDF